MKFTARYHWFIYQTDEHNPDRKMLFSEISIRQVISATYVSTDHISKAVAFQSKEQAMIYLYSNVKPFTSTEAFKRMGVTEILTTYCDIRECLLYSNE